MPTGIYKRSRVDLTGKKFNKLLVIQDSQTGIKGRCIYILVQCDCGTRFEALVDNVKTGKSSSCGCSHITHGMTNSREYKTWEAMCNKM